METIGGFFTARAKNFRYKLVLPSKWVFDLKTSKLVNNSINSNQHYLCYYSTKAEHRDANDVPIADPAFGERTEGVINIDQLWEGCFDVYLLKHFSK